MEPPDHGQPDEQPSSEPTPGGERENRNGGRPTAGPPAIETTDPLVRSGPASRSRQMIEPDGNMVIETNRIREPDAASTPTYVMVPVEIERSARSRSDAGGGEGRAKERNSGKDREGHDNPSSKDDESHSHQDRDHDRGESGERHTKDQGKASQPPSLTRILLYAGIVSLVCGVVGALGASYFFGSGKSSDQKSASKGSSSSGGSDSDKGSDSSGGSDSGSGSGGGAGSKPRSGPSTGQAETSKLLQAEGAWLAAVKELQQSKTAEADARRSEQETKGVLDFLKRTLFSAGRPGDVSLTEAFWGGGQGKDVMLSKALESTESQVADAFGERPLAEASVRELLGLAYMNLGDAPQAVTQYERALALRQAVQGASSPEMAACRNQLAVAYRLAGRADDGSRLFDRGADSPARATSLAINGSMLLAQKKPADAELKLRECLKIREKLRPDDWTTFDTKSTLGEALRDQRKFAEAEPLLVSGYEGMESRQDTIPSADRPRLTRALDRLVKLYEDWGKPDQATQWKQRGSP